MAGKKRKGGVAKARPHLLAQLAEEPEKLFSGAFRQQYGAVCFRYVGETSNVGQLSLEPNTTLAELSFRFESDFDSADIGSVLSVERVR